MYWPRLWGGQVIGLDQGGDIGISDGGIGSQKRDAGGLGLGDGIFEDGRIDRADDDGGGLAVISVSMAWTLGIGILGFGGQIDELDTLGLGFGGGGFAQTVPVIVAGGIARVGNRDAGHGNFGLLRRQGSRGGRGLHQPCTGRHWSCR